MFPKDLNYRMNQTPPGKKTRWIGESSTHYQTKFSKDEGISNVATHTSYYQDGKKIYRIDTHLKAGFDTSKEVQIKQQRVLPISLGKKVKEKSGAIYSLGFYTDSTGQKKQVRADYDKKGNVLRVQDVVTQ